MANSTSDVLVGNNTKFVYQENSILNYFSSLFIRRYNCNFLHLIFLTIVKYMNGLINE